MTRGIYEVLKERKRKRLWNEEEEEVGGGGKGDLTLKGAVEWLQAAVEQ